MMAIINTAIVIPILATKYRPRICKVIRICIETLAKVLTAIYFMKICITFKLKMSKKNMTIR